MFPFVHQSKDADKADRVTVVVFVVVDDDDDDDDDDCGLIIRKYTQYPHQTTLQSQLNTSPSPHTPSQTLPAWVIQIKYQVFIRYAITYTTGPSCSKLTMSLVNDSLKF